MEIDADRIIDSALGCLREKDDFQKTDKEEMTRLIRAVVFGVCQGDHHPFEIKQLLAGLKKKGNGFWLDSVQRALIVGLNKLGPKYEEYYKPLIIGSFLMARHWLYDLEGNNGPFERAGIDITDLEKTP